jgi:multidrug efflux pump subunit AcrA (membrane-fusion protein)
MRRTRCFAVVPLLFMLSCTKPKEEAETAAPAPVQVAAVTQATIHRIVNGDGTLFPQDQASVVPKISAPVQKFHINRGDHVKQGQLLAVLENRDLVAAAAESKAALDQAESNLRAIQGATLPEEAVKARADLEAAREARDAAKKVLDSRQELFKQGALAGRLVDEAQVAYSQANSQYQAAAEHLRAQQSVSREEQIKAAAAQVESARARNQSQEAQVSYTRIVSPIAGVIADRPLYEGEMAGPGAPLLTIMDLSRVVARVNVPQADAAQVKVGQAAVVTQTETGTELNGKVTVVSPATDPNATTVQVWVMIDNPGERLKPGTSVHAAIVTEELKDATVVPSAAILPGEEGGAAVLIVTPDSTAHKKIVTVGIREGDQVQIVSGASPGEQVIVVGGIGVDDGAKVKIVSSPAKEK